MLLALIAVALFACDSDDDSGGTPTETPTDSQTAAPTSGGEITIQITEPESLDPHFVGFSADITIQQMVNRGLYDLLPDGELSPAYAADLPQVSDDGLVYTIPIKSGMQWADGEPLDANDFVLGIQRTCNPDIAGYYQSVLSDITGCSDYSTGDGTLENVGVEAIDPLTLQITLDAPKATFPLILSLWATYPAPNESLGDVAAQWSDPPNTPCSGPFCITEWIAGDRLTLVKNETWGLGQANLDTITLAIIDDRSSALVSFDNEVDTLHMTRVAASDLPLVQERPEFLVQPLPATIALQWVMTDPLMSDPNVRLALSQATDRQLFNDVVNEGTFVPTTNWIPSGEPGANPDGFVDDVIGFDPGAARDALAEAGYPGGDGFPGVTILLALDSNDRLAGEFLQEQWQEILGIEVRLDERDGQAYQELYNDSQFQIALVGWGHDYPDAESWLIGLFETGASLNKHLCSMEEVDDLLGQAATETDQDTRWGLLQEAERIILENLCGIAPLYHLANLYMIDADLRGVEPAITDHYYPQFPENWSLSE